MQMKIITRDDPAEEIEIPYLSSDNERRDLLEDMARTLDGSGRKDCYNGAKRMFSLQHNLLDPTQWQKIFATMDSIAWRETDIYLEHLGGTISAFLSIESKRNRGKRLTTFSTDLRDMTIEVMEV